jgi:hypothetical protein
MTARRPLPEQGHQAVALCLQLAPRLNLLLQLKPQEEVLTVELGQAPVAWRGQLLVRVI